MKTVARRLERWLRSSSGIRGKRPALLASFLMALACAGPAHAQDAAAEEPVTIPEGSVGGMGDINLFPRRIVLDGRERIATVGLYNRTANEGDYEIGISNMVMAPNGQIFAVDSLPAGVSTERLQAADEMLRWSPRRVTLLGNEAQTVRIMARTPADLPPGEYRSHFSVTSIPRDVEGGLSIEDAVLGETDGGSDIGVVIRPRFGIAIPVIVRVGETTLDVSLSDVALVNTEQGPMFTVTINRSGTRSAYGDVIVTMRGQDTPMAVARGVGVYPEVDSRPIMVALDPEFDASLIRQGAVIRIDYIDDDVSPGSSLDSVEFAVP